MSLLSDAFHQRYGWSGPLEEYERLSLYVCHDCGGVVVADTNEHDRWHAERETGA